MALIIAGERSGVGKTTITLAILSFLSQKGAKVQSFKVGPDYIDPMFHTHVTGLPCRNLDPVLTSEAYVQNCYARHAQGVDYALIEGVMGLFDGISLNNCQDFASTAHIARLLNLPVLLVLDCSRLSGSIAAIASGYRNFDPKVNIVGVILNRVGSDRHLTQLSSALDNINLPILGVVHREDDLKIPDRHLGLVPTDELPHLKQLFHKLANLAQSCFNWEKLLPLLTPNISPNEPEQPQILIHKNTQYPRIGIARDRAFNFYYQDNLDLLTEQGAELVYWSPLEDPHLPLDIQGLYIGGGFPEVFAQTLSENHNLHQEIKNAIAQGMPIYAECGGLMYLCQEIIDFLGQTWPMLGILPTTAIMGAKLTLGYRKAIALQPEGLIPQGKQIWGHEFHRSHLTQLSPKPVFQLQGYLAQDPIQVEGWTKQNLHASYVHLHFGNHPHLVQKILQTCLAFPKNIR
ncbi:MAG: cobyrinic acid a,c-diamide synthase [Snowella sp.]|nr:MAG: cobyrinic acid a,c-diamide synthase [Snowella sp.]